MSKGHKRVIPEAEYIQAYVFEVWRGLAVGTYLILICTKFPISEIYIVLVHVISGVKFSRDQKSDFIYKAC